MGNHLENTGLKELSGNSKYLGKHDLGGSIVLAVVL